MSGHNFDHLFNKYALDDASENKHKKRSSPFSSFNQRASDASSSQKTDSTGSGSTLCETGQKVDYFNLKTKYSTGRLVSAQHVGLSMYEAHCEPKSNSNSTNKEPTDNDHHNSFDKHKSSVHNRSSFAETRETKSTSHQSLPIDKVSQFISRLNTKPASIERFSTSNNFHRASNKDHSSASYSQREPSVNVSSFSTNVSEGKSSSSHSTAIIKVNQFIARLNSKPISFGYLPSHNSSKKVSDETSSTSHLSSRVLIKNSPSAHSAFHRDLLPSQLTEKQRNPTNQNYVSPNNIEVCSTNIDPDLESLIASTISTSVPETPIHKRSLGLPSLRNLPTTKSTEETSSQPKKPKLEILPNFFAPDAFARPYSSTSRPAFQEHRPSPISQSLPAVSVNQVESLKKPPNCKNVLSKDKKVPNVSKQTKISDFFPTVKHTEGQHTNAGRSCESTKHSNIVTLPFSDVQHSFQSNCQDVVESNHLNYDEVIEAKPFDQLSQEFSQMNFVPDAPIQIRPDHHKPVNVEMLIDRPDFEVDESLRFAYQKLRQARQQLEQRFFWDETAFNKGEQVPADRQELCGILKKPTISKYFKKRLIQKYWNSFPDLNEVCLDPEPMEVIDLEINGSSQSLTPVSQPTQDSMFCNLPSEFRSLFKDFAGFNNLQKMIFDDLIKSNVSLAISAPTGCGKTVAFELAIIKQIMEKCSEKPSVVMISPLKAICKEKFK